MAVSPLPIRLILASASPRRRDLLAAWDLAGHGYGLELAPSDVDEAALASGLKPEQTVRVLGQAKAQAVARRHKAAVAAGEAVVLGADTVVVADGETIGKPRDDTHTRQLLRRFSGGQITVLTGTTLISSQGESHRLSQTVVGFHPIDELEIDDYVASGVASDKAGGLELQGAAASFVAMVGGCWTNVLGLPLCQVRELIGIDTQDCPVFAPITR